MIWDTRSSSGTPVATLGVRAGEQRTTHTGEQTHAHRPPYYDTCAAHTRSVVHRCCCSVCVHCRVGDLATQAY